MGDATYWDVLTHAPAAFGVGVSEPPHGGADLSGLVSGRMSGLGGVGDATPINQPFDATISGLPTGVQRPTFLEERDRSGTPAPALPRDAFGAEYGRDPCQWMSKVLRDYEGQVIPQELQQALRNGLDRMILRFPDHPNFKTWRDRFDTVITSRASKVAMAKLVDSVCASTTTAPLPADIATPDIGEPDRQGLKDLFAFGVRHSRETKEAALWLQTAKDILNPEELLVKVNEFSDTTITARQIDQVRRSISPDYTSTIQKPAHIDWGDIREFVYWGGGQTLRTTALVRWVQEQRLAGHTLTDIQLVLASMWPDLTAEHMRLFDNPNWIRRFVTEEQGGSTANAEMEEMQLKDAIASLESTLNVTKGNKKYSSRQNEAIGNLERSIRDHRRQLGYVEDYIANTKRPQRPTERPTPATRPTATRPTATRPTATTLDMGDEKEEPEKRASPDDPESEEYGKHRELGKETALPSTPELGPTLPGSMPPLERGTFGMAGERAALAAEDIETHFGAPEEDEKLLEHSTQWWGNKLRQLRKKRADLYTQFDNIKLDLFSAKKMGFRPAREAKLLNRIRTVLESETVPKEVRRAWTAYTKTLKSKWDGLQELGTQDVEQLKGDYKLRGKLEWESWKLDLKALQDKMETSIEKGERYMATADDYMLLFRVAGGDNAVLTQYSELKQALIEDTHIKKRAYDELGFDVAQMEANVQRRQELKPPRAKTAKPKRKAPRAMPPSAVQKMKKQKAPAKPAAPMQAPRTREKKTKPKPKPTHGVTVPKVMTGLVNVSPNEGPFFEVAGSQGSKRQRTTTMIRHEGPMRGKARRDRPGWQKARDRTQPETQRQRRHREQTGGKRGPARFISGHGPPT